LKKPTLPTLWARRFAEGSALRRHLGRERVITEPGGLDFSSNDYLGLRLDPRLLEAAQRAASRFGSGTGAARLLRGTTPVHAALEEALAAWKGQEAALLFNTGYQCNATVIPSLAGPGDAVFSDRLNHASIVDGCRLARAGGAQVEVFRHLDLQDLAAQIRAWREAGGRGLALVVTDTVFSMDGDAADLPGLLKVCQAEDALLMVDEAHATGLLGPTGAGLAEAQGVAAEVPLVMGTLGKALGSFGAFVACSGALRDHLVNTCRGFIFSTALPAPVAAAGLAAVGLAQAEPFRRQRALGHAARLRSALALPSQPSAIVPVLLGSEASAMARAAALQAAGFDVRAVRPPTVPEGTSRLRITTGAHLTRADLSALVQAMESQP
jgi:8-amino-7-oxononanoate synthase